MNSGTTLIGLLLALMIAGPIIYFIARATIEKKTIQRKIRELSDSYHLGPSEHHSFNRHHFVMDTLQKKILYIEFAKSKLERHIVFDSGSIKHCEISIDSYKGPTKMEVIREIYMVVNDVAGQCHSILLFSEKDGDSLLASEVKREAENVVKRIKSLF
ncbi:hypothetical protein [Galbibacter sp. PAP.153]|uniref:hypothetical protein n=1 Tax=Galbibacter sp. PAP.153 TaxID=3104623 RepID=UPI00300978FE